MYLSPVHPKTTERIDSDAISKPVIGKRTRSSGPLAPTA